MRIIWEITDEDSQRALSFYEAQESNPFVKKRIERNINKVGVELSEAAFWQQMIMCLLTSQQRSGPDSPISRFMRITPFRLSLHVCKGVPNLRGLVKKELLANGCGRMIDRVSTFISENFEVLERGKWGLVSTAYEKLGQQAGSSEEMLLARTISSTLKGFGPKQARNLLQSLGLTRYEVPIDSRISKWLNEFGFPIKISVGALSDEEYYQFVSDGFQLLCKRIAVFPAVMDAAIFSSFDSGWSADNVVF